MKRFRECEEDCDAADRMERRELGMGEFRSIEDENVIDDRLVDEVVDAEDEEWYEWIERDSEENL